MKFSKAAYEGHSPIKSACNGFVYPHSHPDRNRWAKMAEHVETGLQHVTNFKCAVDCGANVGLWTARMARKFEYVHAFEPWGMNYYCLKVNMLPFSNVKSHCCAVGKHTGTVSMIANDSHIGKAIETSKGGIRMVNLDSFNWPLGFLKIDVEGFELDVIEGAKSIIDRNSPVIMSEYKHCDPTDLLSEMGYRVVEDTGLDRVYVR